MTSALPLSVVTTSTTRVSLSPKAPNPEVTTDAVNVPASSSDIGSSRQVVSFISSAASLAGASPLKTSCLDATLVDPRFLLPRCDLPPRNELEPVEIFVAKAVKEQHQLQETQIQVNYRAILEAFRFKNDLLMLRKLLIALRTSGSTLNLLTSDSNKHARLIHQILRLLPFAADTVVNAADVRRPLSPNCDAALADAQFHLIQALVSANSVFLVPAMTALWKMLAVQICDSHPERTRRIHAALATIMRLCPKAKTELLPIITANAPFRMRPEAELVWYYKQCLFVTEYLPAVRGQILVLVINRCLEMDVEIKITDVGEATIDTTAEDCGDAAIFQLDLDDDENKAVLLQDITVDEMADKLDSLMLLLFEHVEHALHLGMPAIDIYLLLSRVFESAIIITHKSKFVQFLILHVCGIEAKAVVTTNHAMSGSGEPVEEALLYREFASKLIDVILDPYRGTVTRQSGACYLASFVSRAPFVCAETACESVDALLRWAEAYIHSLGSLSVHAPDAREQCCLHSLFYTVCQSAYYIMCFRGAEVVRLVRGSPEKGNAGLLSHLDLSASRWTKICAHPLLPLRYCLESVRSEFLRISNVLSLLDGAVLERLGKDELRSSVTRQQRKKKIASLITTAATLEKERLRGGVGGLGGGTNPLDSFFPFDPYLLRRSHSHVEPYYKHWDGGVSENDIADDNDEDRESADVVDGSDDDAGSQNNSSDSDHSDSDSDADDTESKPNNARKRFMSFASNTTSISSRPGSLEDKTISAGAVMTTRVELKKAWSTTVKRPRAPTSENGSW